MPIRYAETTRRHAHCPQRPHPTARQPLNKAALAFIVAGFIAPATNGLLRAGWQATATFAWVGAAAASGCHATSTDLCPSSWPHLRVPALSRGNHRRDSSF
jgi:hypothetical protein